MRKSRGGKNELGACEDKDEKRKLRLKKKRPAGFCRLWRGWVGVQSTDSLQRNIPESFPYLILTAAECSTFMPDSQQPISWYTLYEDELSMDRLLLSTRLDY